MTKLSRKLSILDDTNENENIRKKRKCESESEHFWNKTFDARWHEWKWEYERAKTSIFEDDLIEVLEVGVLYR